MVLGDTDPSPGAEDNDPVPRVRLTMTVGMGYCDPPPRE
ncbi:hypothetical protein FMEAI12_2130011 [Parafrankia sp. Ea1.12]|nr:hypothetical protein FMEAI12_2130011 [Parafrankia sp. Ea1.12]